MTLATLADVRTLIERHLPAECRAKTTWQCVAKDLTVAAAGEREPAEVSLSLRMALSLEGVECRPQRRRVPAAMFGR